MTDTAPSQKASELAAKYADSVRGKVVLTTGASPKSIGKGFVEALAAHQPGLLIIAGRNDERNQEVVDGLKAKFPEVKARTLKLNLLSLKAVREAAEQVHQWEDVPQIDVLALSAGIMAPGWAKSEDGFESQFATNHLGHFLFTNLIIEKVLKAPNPRVVVVSSDGHRLNPIRFDDYNFHEGESYDKWTAYGQSKTANNLFAVSLAQKLGKSKNLKAYPINPGVVLSNLAGHLDFEKDFADMRVLDQTLGNPHAWWTSFNIVSADEGASTYVYAAFAPEIADKNGAYLTECRIADPWKGDTLKPWATDLVEAERLWKLSEKLVGQEYNY
jgi:NAD(P)-dependent dehydrogenase (short-subunit alcohol dehydrogenase family)